MRKTSFAVLSCLLLLGALQTAFAEDCVEVDLELPAVVPVGPGNSSEGYFELTNCGDEAATIDLTLLVNFMGEDIEIGPIPVPLDAGETASRAFRFAAPPGLAGQTVELCVRAVSGTAESSDCATVTFEGGTMASGGDANKLNFSLAAGTSDCVEVDLELPDTVDASIPGVGWAEGYFELINCGDEAAEIQLGVEASLSIEDIIDTTFTLSGIPVKLDAGESISRELRFPVPPLNGVYGLCVTATSGDAVSVSCQTMVVIGGNDPGEPIQACGELVQGAGCVLFAPAGEEQLLVLDNYGGFQAGDNVCVAGMLVIGCETECPEATGCVVNNAIYTWNQGTTSSAVTSRNYPNPFNPSTVIQFSLPEAAEVSVTVYNSLGQSVKELVTNTSMPAGNHQIEWDGTNYSGKTVSSGIYLYRIEAGQHEVTKKMVLTR
jgi:hypothetical protein